MWLVLLNSRTAAQQNSLPGGNRALEPPDPIPNSEVKRCIADDSVGLPHVKVGHCQALNYQPLIEHSVRGFLLFLIFILSVKDLVLIRE